jgi:hypothetical protein
MAKAKKKTTTKPQRGKYLTAGRGWRLLSRADRAFHGTLLHTFNMGKTRLAIFSVPK